MKCTLRRSSLFARVKSPGSKSEKRQRSSRKALEQAIRDLKELMAITGTMSVELLDPDGSLVASIRAAWEKHKAEKAKGDANENDPGTEL